MITCLYHTYLALETGKCTLLGISHVTEKKEVQDQTLFVVHGN